MVAVLLPDATIQACFGHQPHAQYQQPQLHHLSLHRRRPRNSLIFSHHPRGLSRCSGFIKDKGEHYDKQIRACGDGACDGNTVLSQESDEKAFPVFEEHLEDAPEWSSIPDHPEAVQALCWTYVASCLVERAWRFGLPALIAAQADNLLPVALNGFIGQAVVFAGGPIVGALLDAKPRVFGFVLLSSMQTVSILISSAVVLYIIKKGVVFGTSALSLLLQPWFIVLVTACSVDRITGIATGVAFERDWVVLLVGQTHTIALANANAMLRRVDLICEIVGPVLFGFALSKFLPTTCVLISSAIAIISLPVLILLVYRTYNLSEGALDRPGQSMNQESKLLLGLETFMHGWLEYLKQPILPASIAYVLLSFNAVLAPSGLMTSFLTQRGLDPAVTGSYRGFCAFMGFLATYIGSILIGKFGTLKAGAISLTYQAALLSLSVLLYWLGPMEKQATLFLFLTLVIFSRLGHWAYDMVIAQIFQTAVVPSQANLLSSTEMSLAGFAELIMLAVAIVASDVSYFGALACLSMASVAGAALLYWAWFTNPAMGPLVEHGYF